MSKEITVKEVIEKLYTRNVINKRIISSKGFIDILEKSEAELLQFSSIIDGRMNFIPEKISEFEVNYQNGNDKIESINIKKDFMESLYTERLRGAQWSIFESYFWNYKNMKCIYCGVNDATTLDHIFPKSKYITLSIVPSNLFRCCTYCNNKKLEFVSDLEVFYPNLGFNLYEILELEEIFLNQDFTLDIKFRNKLDKYDDTIIAVGIKERVSNIINSEISQFLAGVLKRYGDSELVFEEFSNHDAMILERDYMKQSLTYLVENKELFNSYKEILKNELSI